MFLIYSSECKIHRVGGYNVVSLGLPLGLPLPQIVFNDSISSTAQTASALGNMGILLGQARAYFLPSITYLFLFVQIKKFFLNSIITFAHDGEYIATQKISTLYEHDKIR